MRELKCYCYAPLIFRLHETYMWASNRVSRSIVAVFELLMFVLVIVAVLLIWLYAFRDTLSKLRPKRKTSVGEKNRQTKLSNKSPKPKRKRKKRLLKQSQKDSPKCPYTFGYLREYDKTAPLPSECLTCSQMLECAASNGKWHVRADPCAHAMLYSVLLSQLISARCIRKVY